MRGRIEQWRGFERREHGDQGDRERHLASEVTDRVRNAADEHEQVGGRLDRDRNQDQDQDPDRAGTDEDRHPDSRAADDDSGHQQLDLGQRQRHTGAAGLDQLRPTGVGLGPDRHWHCRSGGRDLRRRPAPQEGPDRRGGAGRRKPTPNGDRSATRDAATRDAATRDAATRDAATRDAATAAATATATAADRDWDSGRATVTTPDGVVLGVDVGTTAVKVGAFGTDGEQLADAFGRYRLYEPHPGMAEQDPLELVDGTLAAIKDAAAAAHERGARIAGVCLSAAMHGLVALDARDRPLCRLITWADTRAFAEAERLAAEHPELHDRTGTPLHPMAPLAKLMWFRKHDRALFDAAQRWVGLKELISARLTGDWVIDHSCATGTGLLALATLDWDPEALALADVTAAQLSAPVPATATLRLSSAAGRATGLAPATPLVIGAGDGPLANLGLGAVDPGTLGCSIGTSGALRLMVEHAGVDRDHCLFCYAFVPGRWLLGGSINNGGAVLEWLGRVLGEPEPDRLLADAASVSAGSDGLVMLPYLLSERAPYWSALPAGAYVGLKHSHGRGHLVRAALEGVCQQLALVLASMRAAGNEVREARATGGFARSPLWRQLLCDVLGLPIGFAAREQGAAFGAALLGMEALGAIGSIELAAATVRITDETRPDPAAAAVYERQRPLFAELYSELVPAFRRLREGVVS